MADKIESEYLRDIAELKRYIEKAYDAGRGSHAAQLEAQLADMEKALKEYRNRMSRPGAKAMMGRWTEESAEGWGDLSKTLTATINGIRWTIVMDASTGKGQLMRRTSSGPQYVKEGSVDQLKRYAETAKSSRPGAKARMAKWTVTPTKKHGKDIEEHTAKIGRDHWKIDSMPHVGKDVGSLYRWDDLRGLRHVSTGNIEQLKRQAEAISTKKDALSDVMRGFSRPGAKVKAGRAEDLYRKLSSGSITYANAKEWERLVTEALRLPDYTPPGGDMSLHEIAEDLGGDLMALKTHRGPVPHAKAKAEKPSDLEREDVKAGLKVMSASDPAVSDKIRTLIAEGKPQDQAVAIALDMKRRGEL